jgi:hypothetical protein
MTVCMTLNPRITAVGVPYDADIGALLRRVVPDVESVGIRLYAADYILDRPHPTGSRVTNMAYSLMRFGACARSKFDAINWNVCHLVFLNVRK